MRKERIYYLLQQYRDNLATAEEVRELFRALRRAEGRTALKKLMAEDWKREEEPNATAPDWEDMWRVIRETAEVRERPPIYFTGRMRTAAVLLLCVLSGAVYWILSGGGREATGKVVSSHFAPIVPGGNKAVLTLGDGMTISLDSAKDGMLAQQGSVKVVKVDAGLLTYNARNKTGEAMMYNTVATPYGGEYQVVLPDGTKVWLNAASSLRFPTAFAGKERRVEMTGEGYFEVARDVSKPFVVHIGSGEDVEVLGTSFNVMAYANEEQGRTTLVSGKVRVLAQGGSVEVEPGKQAVVDRARQGLTIMDANVDQVIAWKNGLFRFHETGIRELMRQVERWYNVQVVYQTDGADQDFSGIVSRSKSIEELLRTLEMTKTVHFRIEGRKIIVLP